MDRATSSTLRRVPLFSRLPDDDLAKLSGQMVPRRYGRHTIVFSQGDAADGLYIVIRGRVHIRRQNAEGSELTLALTEPGEYFGELALLDQEPRSAGAVAAEPCELLFLSRAAFRSFLEQHPAALFTCLEVIVRRLRSLTDLADDIALVDVRSRLARRLLRLADQGIVAEEHDGGPVGRQPDHRITQEELATMLGATRQSVNKHLSAFVDEGIIRLDRGEIRIRDRPRLLLYSQSGS